MYLSTMIDGAAVAIVAMGFAAGRESCLFTESTDVSSAITALDGSPDGSVMTASTSRTADCTFILQEVIGMPIGGAAGFPLHQHDLGEIRHSAMCIVCGSSRPNFKGFFNFADLDAGNRDLAICIKAAYLVPLACCWILGVSLLRPH